MLKKLLFCAMLTLGSTALFAQTIVSTNPENRNVVLEEFTGINCQFCPDGHAIAQAFKDDFPDDVFLVNIHSGGFANPGAGQPDFRTPFGEAIDDQSQLAGYPAGTVNRENFSGSEQGGSPAGATAQGRGTWVATGTTLFDQSSYLNMAVEADIDVQTNQMTIHVETYYTADSPEATNKLNVYILQNGTTGPQSGANQGNNYVHQHRLIDMPLGQWGADITSTTMGSLDDRTITYDIPGDINGIPVEIANLEVVVSVAEGTQYIVSGNGSLPTFSGITATNDANLRTIADIPETCLPEVGTQINVQNLGQDPITSLDITYSINGGAEELFTWTGNITSLQSTDIDLPAISYVSQATNTINVAVADDENNANNTISTSFDNAQESAGTVILEILTDTWAEELSWEFLDSSGTVLESETYTGGAGGGAAGDDNTLFEYVIDLPEDCVTFNVNDAFGDGLTEGAGGYVQLSDANGIELYAQNGDYGSGFSLQFGSDGVVVLGTAEETFETLTIYPNPAEGFFFIKNAENADIEIFTPRGRKVRRISKVSKNEKVETNRMPSGVYFVTITKDGFTTTKKVIVK